MRRLTPAELTTADPAELLPVRDVAHLLDVTPNTVRKWIHDGRLGTAIVAGRHHVLLPHASAVEHQTRTSTRGRPRQMTTRGFMG